MNYTTLTSRDGQDSTGALTTWETAYCFAHQGRATMTVTTFHADRQEKVVCDHCGAEGYGPAANPVQVVNTRVKDLRVGDVILTRTGYQNEVTSAPRALGGTGQCGFGLRRQDRADWEGRLDALDTVTVARAI